jgi:hypothetical protein
MARAQLIAVVLPCAIAGCAFDLGRLMEPPPDGAPMIDVITDAPVDVLVDSGPQRACVSLLDTSVGRVIGGSLVVSGTTVGATHLIDPPSTCTMASRGAPERYFNYQVQRGGTLVATTEVASMGASCPLASDTIVSILRGSCDAPGEDLACNDDAEDPSKCLEEGSRAIATGLSAGDLVMIVVDGYRANAGPFTLTLVENPLREAPPLGSIGLLCACPTSAATTMTEDVAVSMASDSASGAAMNGRLELAGQYIGGARTTSGTVVKGVAGVLGLLANDFATRPECRSRAATFDVYLGNNAVRAFTIDSSTDIARTPRLMFRSASDVPISAGTRVRIQLRATQMPTAGGPCGVQFSSAGTLTLLTAR